MMSWDGSMWPADSGFPDKMSSRAHGNKVTSIYIATSVLTHVREESEPGTLRSVDRHDTD
uniref:(California timema) hypothetical protein n=1 Tax=Timema californicum TaxID=61474 RepID=A0A7R9JAS4_TIMCA|nr:unnamed protein product [Timema californicum]